MLKSPSTYGYNSTLFLETSPAALILKPCRQKLFPSLLYQSINSDIQKQSYEAISNPFTFFLLIQFIFHIRRCVPTNNTSRGFLSGLVVAQLCPSLISRPDPKIPAQFLTIQLFRLSLNPWIFKLQDSHQRFFSSTASHLNIWPSSWYSFKYNVKLSIFINISILTLRKSYNLVLTVSVNTSIYLIKDTALQSHPSKDTCLFKVSYHASNRREEKDWW